MLEWSCYYCYYLTGVGSYYGGDYYADYSPDRP